MKSNKKSLALYEVIKKYIWKVKKYCVKTYTFKIKNKHVYIFS